MATAQTLEAIRIYSGRIEIRLPYGSTPGIREALPGARWDSRARCWHVPATPYYARRLLAARYPIPDDCDLSDIESLASLAPPPSERGAVRTPRGTPYKAWPHQEDGARFCAARRASLLAWEMGTGKTKAIIDLIFGTDTASVLVVCPKAVVEVWEAQVGLHAPKGHRYTLAAAKGGGNRTVSIIRAAEKRRRDGRFIVIVNYDLIYRSPVYDVLTELPWDIVVADESHRISNPQTKSCKAICTISASADRRICLSGTPLRNGPLDIFGQAKFLDPGLYGTAVTPFRDRYGVWKQFDRFRKLTGYKNMDEFRAIYKQFVHTVRKSDVLELPTVTHSMIPVSLPREAASKYRTMAEGYIAEFESGDVLAQHAAVRLLRLQQIASGSLYDGDSGITHKVHEAKKDALVELMSEADPDEPIVVFGRFRSCISQAASAAEASGRSFFEVSGSVNEYKKWREDKTGAVIGVQVQSGSEGLDLTRSATAVFITAPHSLAQFEQACARVDRPGQKRPVSIYHICARGTVDTSVYRALREKREIIEEVTGSPRGTILGE